MLESTHASPTAAPALEPLLTPARVAQILDVPEPTLAAWRSTGRVKLPYISVGGAVRYRSQDIADFIDRNLQNAD